MVTPQKRSNEINDMTPIKSNVTANATGINSPSVVIVPPTSRKQIDDESGKKPSSAMIIEDDIPESETM